METDRTTKDDSEFVAVSLADREVISGKTLMITAYGVIFFLIVLYLTSILFRERRVAAAAGRLEKIIKSS